MCLGNCYLALLLRGLLIDAQGQYIRQVGEVQLGRYIHKPASQVRILPHVDTARDSRDQVRLEPLGEYASLDDNRIGAHQTSESSTYISLLRIL